MLVPRRIVKDRSPKVSRVGHDLRRRAAPEKMTPLAEPYRQRGVGYADVLRGVVTNLIGTWPGMNLVDDMKIAAPRDVRLRRTDVSRRLRGIGLRCCESCLRDVGRCRRCGENGGSGEQQRDGLHCAEKAHGILSYFEEI